MEMIVIDHKQFDIEESKALEIQKCFQPHFDNINNNKSLVDKLESEFQENPLDKNLAKRAKELRSQFVTFRTGATKLHTTLKKRALDYGRCVDSWKNLQNKNCEDIENRLREIEQYEENLRKAEIDESHRKRSLEIAKYTNDIPQQLGEMTESVYQMILDGVIKMHNDAIEAKRLADEEEKNRQIKLVEEKRQMELDRQELDKQRKEMLEKQAEANKKLRELEAEKQRIQDEADRIEKEKLVSHQRNLLAQHMAKFFLLPIDPRNQAELELGNSDQEMKNALNEVITSRVKLFDDELFNKTDEQLEDYWFFEWDNDKPIEQNFYNFFDLLNFYAQQCKRWEEHHHGHVCLVERVRDKYIMPKINTLVEKIKK